MSAEPRLLDPLLGALHYAELGVLIVSEHDARLRYSYVNEACATMLGYTKDQLVAVTPAELLEPDVLESLQHPVGADEARPPQCLETSLRHRDGRRVPVELVAHSLTLDGDRSQVLLVRCLLPRQHAQLSLLEADRVALVSALAAGVAHEVKNPLMGMLLALRVLRRTLAAELPEPTRTAALRALDDSLSGGERIAGNVAALLSLASASGEERELDLGAVTASALRLVSPILEDRARVVRELLPVPPVRGDEARLGQAVLAMLLFSGSGFHGDDPRDNRIVVRVEAVAPWVSIEVSDNGGALSAKDLARAFDPFFVSRGRGAGLGVGLGVARSIALAHGGSLEMIARGEIGLTMCLKLPSAAVHAGAGALAREAAG